MNEFSLTKTEDGSQTLFFPEYGENTHTVHGAYTEALYKHIFPSGILCRKEQDIYVLDIGFGLGYNLLALLAEWKPEKEQTLSIYSFEKERAIAPFLEKLELPEELESPFRLIRKAFTDGIYEEERLRLEILWGDARRTIPRLEYLQGKVSAVFQDPHSPGKNSELWTVEFFQKLFGLMDTEARLTTYSFAPQVRSGLLEAGFRVAPFTSERFHKEGTLASKSPLPGALTGSAKEELLANVKSTPYRDNPSMVENREDIRLRRVEEMAERRRIMRDL